MPKYTCKTCETCRHIRRAPYPTHTWVCAHHISDGRGYIASIPDRGNYVDTRLCDWCWDYDERDTQEYETASWRVGKLIVDIPDKDRIRQAVRERVLANEFESPCEAHSLAYAMAYYPEIADPDGVSSGVTFWRDDHTIDKENSYWHLVDADDERLETIVFGGRDITPVIDWEERDLLELTGCDDLRELGFVMLPKYGWAPRSWARETIDHQ